MNNTFEWTRFCKVVRKDFSNIWQNAGTTLLTITLLPILAWLMWLVMGGLNDLPAIVPEARWAMIFGTVSLAAMFTPSRMYRTCNIPKEGSYFAMLPASKLEKYLSMLLFSIVVCPLLCLLGGIVLDYFLTLLPFGPYSKWLWQTDYLSEGLDHYRALRSRYFPDTDTNLLLLAETISVGKVLLYAVLYHLSTVATFLFTTTIFKKHKVLQTLLWEWLIGFVLNLIITPILTLHLINGNLADSIWATADPAQIINIIYWAATAWAIVFSAVLFWWAGHRLKHMKY